jgi:hypothetical protein
VSTPYYYEAYYEVVSVHLFVAINGRVGVQASIQAYESWVSRPSPRGMAERVNRIREQATKTTPMNFFTYFGTIEEKLNEDLQDLLLP